VPFLMLTVRDVFYEPPGTYSDQTNNLCCVTNAVVRTNGLQ